MPVACILSTYFEVALDQALYDRLDDGSYSGRIPTCPGVVAFAPTLRQCERELRSTLEDWVLLGIKLNHRLPVLGGVDLNQEPAREPVDAL
ncbi:MAG: type II toxin-antitoxin system HicB family antitoxin [Bryobacteraceae bacterium]